MKPTGKPQPPNYAPPIAALLLSADGRARPLKESNLEMPPTMPPRGIPDSEDARILGSLCQGRQRNIYKRFYLKAVSKIKPPLEITGSSTQKPLIKLETEGLDLLRHVERMAGFENGEKTTSQDGPRPTHWMRRRYQGLLSHIPLLLEQNGGKGATVYNVDRSKHARPDGRQPARTTVKMDEAFMAWLDKGSGKTKKR